MSPTRVNSPHELIRRIERPSRIFVHGASATPPSLVEALTQDKSRLSGSELMHLHVVGPASYADCQEFRVTNLFVGENLRGRVNCGRVDYLPCFLSEVPQLFHQGIRAPDVALLQVSPPAASGYCSLGTSVDVARAAVSSAKLVLAQVNPAMPRTHGDAFIPFSRIHAYWEQEMELPEPEPRSPTPEEEAIGGHVASLVEDGSTIQVGIGNIPNAVLARLKNHKRLGLHTETFSDGVLPLLESGVMDHSQKAVHRGKAVTSFIAGSKKLYSFVNDNPSVIFLESDYVNDTRVIARNPKVVAINSAVEIDLTGQVVADSVGTRIISGVGGQMDFVRGASLSPGGKAVIAFTSRTKRGRSRIVSLLQSGAGVVTTRAHVHYVVTEFGAVNLFGKTLSERAKALISIAHPDHREKLNREWSELWCSL